MCACFDPVKVYVDKQENDNDPAGKLGNSLDDDRDVLVAEQKAKHGEELVSVVVTARLGVPHGGVVPVHFDGVLILGPRIEPADLLELLKSVQDKTGRERDKNETGYPEERLDIRDEQALQDESRHCNTDYNGKNPWDEYGTSRPVTLDIGG